MKKSLSILGLLLCFIFIGIISSISFFSPATAAGVPILGQYLSNGQILVGSTGAAPVATTLTGTAGQITVTNGAGSITLSGPQSLATTSSPTFKDLTITYGVAAATAVYTSTLEAATLNTGQGAYELYKMDQNVDTTASPSFAAATVTTLNVSGSGQVLLGNATSAALGALAPGQAKGALILNSNTGNLCMSTATAVGSWVIVSTPTLACY